MVFKEIFSDKISFGKKNWEKICIGKRTFLFRRKIWSEKKNCWGRNFVRKKLSGKNKEINIGKIFKRKRFFNKIFVFIKIFEKRNYVGKNMRKKIFFEKKLSEKEIGVGGILSENNCLEKQRKKLLGKIFCVEKNFLWKKIILSEKINVEIFFFLGLTVSRMLIMLTNIRTLV